MNASRHARRILLPVLALLAVAGTCSPANEEVILPNDGTGLRQLSSGDLTILRNGITRYCLLGSNDHIATLIED